MRIALFRQYKKTCGSGRDLGYLIFIPATTLKHSCQPIHDLCRFIDITITQIGERSKSDFVLIENALVVFSQCEKIRGEDLNHIKFRKYMNKYIKF